jgi:hypothetical protein
MTRDIYHFGRAAVKIFSVGAYHFFRDVYLVVFPTARSLPVNSRIGLAMHFMGAPNIPRIRPYLARTLLGWSPRKAGLIDGMETYYAEWKASQGI